nr:hypothetical protein [Candidatus Enterousia merdequi]
SIDGFGMIVRHYNAGEERPGTCNVSELGVSEDEATSDMDADFRPNIITINWANTQGVKAGSTDKTINNYDGTVQKSTHIVGKQGYKFVGWKVSGVKTCADFSGGTAEECVSHQNCIWKDNTCISNPCITTWLPDTQDDPITYQYGEYNYKTGECAYNTAM